MSNLNGKFSVLAADEFFSRVPEVMGHDPDFAHFCANLVARPRFGYGPIEAKVNASGQVIAFTYGLPVNDVFEE